MSVERVFAEQEAVLRRRLRRMTGDAQAAEDLTQEVFVRAWRRAPRDVPDEVLRAWLHRTASNLAVDELRRRARQPVGDVDDLATHAAPTVGGGPDDGAAREALAQLAPHDRLVLLLRFHAGLSLRELGELLAISEEAARKRVGRARRRFADALHAARREPGPLVLLLVREEDPEPYEAWLRRAGARVRTVRGDASERDVLFADALVVSGSRSDVHPRVYGQAPTPVLHGDPDVRADWRDLAALRAALRADLPLIGVCRGHQLLNVLSGGALYQDVGLAGGSPVAHGTAAHAVRTATASLVRGLVGRRPSVPSEHHQAVSRIGRGLRVAAVSADGMVESVERTDRRFAVGVQWKPPRAPDDDASRRLAEALVEQASGPRRAAA
jgi:gamma-glutamyl-gamma-aminobutyrate hydrolase PuuD/DNA-directed RNA polymerase specialized sigma24 family protein